MFLRIHILPKLYFESKNSHFSEMEKGVGVHFIHSLFLQACEDIKDMRSAAWAVEPYIWLLRERNGLLPLSPAVVLAAQYFVLLGLPWWLRLESLGLRCGRPGFDPWVRKIPWRRKWHPTPVLLLGKSHGRRILVGYGPWGCKELDLTERLHFHFHPSFETEYCIDFS